jgi:hypothetical protein
MAAQGRGAYLSISGHQTQDSMMVEASIETLVDATKLVKFLTQSSGNVVKHLRG